METERKLPFLDVLIERNGSNLETSVYRKKTNNNLYMNWNSRSPQSWKTGTLRNLTRRAIMISSATASKPAPTLATPPVDYARKLTPIPQMMDRYIERVRMMVGSIIYKGKSGKDFDKIIPGKSF